MAESRPRDPRHIEATAIARDAFRYHPPMSPLLAIAGAIPALVAMAYVDWIDRKRPEPRSKLRLVALLGALSVIPCGILELLLVTLSGSSFGEAHTYGQAMFQAFVVAALVEEAAKLAVLRLVAWRFAAFDERLDGIVYAARAGLGFALVENIGYLAMAPTAGAFVAMFLVRAIFTVPMHALSASMMGYYAAKRRFDGSGPGILAGFALAVLLHGSFDGGLFALIIAARVHDTAIILFALSIPLICLIAAWRFVRRLSRRALEADDAASRRAEELRTMA
jgi:RsiW-degrading membrane proteinase PrsW (M82 family)